MFEIKRRSGPGRHKNLRVTQLSMRAGHMKILFQIESPVHLKQRRVIALAIFRQLIPVLKIMENSRIHHLDGHQLNFFTYEYREISGATSTNLTTREGQVGFIIRMYRLEAGLTLAELGRSAGINGSHLSEIERGKYKARLETLSRLTSALGPDFGQELRRLQSIPNSTDC